MNNQKIPDALAKANTLAKTSNEETIVVNGIHPNQLSLKQPTDNKITKVEPPERDWSPSLQSLLDQPSATLPQKMIIGGTVFFLAFSIWAWFGEIDEIGKAQGKLIPKGETYKVESVELGKVSHIAVQEGEQVKAGQLLAELDNTLVAKEVERLKQMLTAYQIELSQKQTLLERVQLEAKTHARISAAETLSQKAAIASAQDKAEVFRQLLAQQKAEMAAYQRRENRSQSLSALAQERAKQLNSEIEAHHERMQRLKPLEEQGAVSQEFIFQAEQARSQTQQQLTESQLQEITNINEQIFQSEQSLRELAAQITQSQGERASALKEVERLKADLERQQAERSKLKLEAEQKIQQLELNITQMQAKIAETQNMLVSAEAKLKQTLLKAPVDGVVLSLNVQNVGKVFQSGQTIAEIASKSSPLVLSAALPNQEAGFVKTEMPVQVKFDAYAHQDYGAVPGKVISISSDAKNDEQIGIAYQVEVELERDHILDNQKPIKFKPGQTATADIIIRRRRILDVLLDPIKKLHKDGIKM